MAAEGEIFELHLLLTSSVSCTLISADTSRTEAVGDVTEYRNYNIQDEEKVPENSSNRSSTEIWQHLS